jgi:hypothetical protein
MGVGVEVAEEEVPAPECFERWRGCGCWWWCWDSFSSPIAEAEAAASERRIGDRGGAEPPYPAPAPAPPPAVKSAATFSAERWWDKAFPLTLLPPCERTDTLSELFAAAKAAAEAEAAEESDRRRSGDKLLAEANAVWRCIW